MESKHEGKMRRARLLAAAALGAALLALLIAAATRTGARETARTGSTVEDGCALVQTLHYARCGHEVTRRVTADKELKGSTLEEVRRAFPEWSITSFAPGEIVMSCALQLYCPDHLVVMPDGAGVLGVYENVYGDGYALKAQLDIPLSALPEETRETAHLGIAFGTESEIEQWLETFES